MSSIGWPAALFLSVVAVLLVALANRVLEWRHELRSNAVIRAYQRESIEANKELERLRHELEISERRRVSAEVELATAQGQLERRHRLN